MYFYKYTLEVFMKYLVNKLVNFNRYRIFQSCNILLQFRIFLFATVAKKQRPPYFSKVFFWLQNLLLYFLSMKLELLNNQVMRHNCLSWIAPGR